MRFPPSRAINHLSFITNYCSFFYLERLSFHRGKSFRENRARLFDQNGFVFVARREMADNQSLSARPQCGFGGIGGGRMAARFGDLLLGGGVGCLVVHQISSRAKPCDFGRKVRVGEIGIRARGIGAVGQFGVGENLARLEHNILAPFGSGDLGDIEAVFSDFVLLDIERRLLFAKQKAGGRHAVAQRDAPHLDRAILEKQFMFGRIDLRPNNLEGQTAVEIAQMRRQNLAEGRRREDLQRRFAPVKPQRGNQREEAETVVAVQVREEDRA